MYQKILLIIILVLVGYSLFYSIKRGLEVENKKYKCSNCGHVSKPNLDLSLRTGWIYHILFKSSLITKCTKCKKITIKNEIPEDYE